MSVHLLLILQLLALLTVANGTPVLAKKLMQDFAAWRIDGGTRFIDGRALFGRSKTLRGVVLAILTTSCFAPVVGLPWTLGCVVGTLAMVGDLFSSFIKRRIKLASSTMAVGLDQVPESLLPILASRLFVGMTFIDIVIATAAFFVGAIIISRLMFELNIRDRPF
jgi:hypothetical protein